MTNPLSEVTESVLSFIRLFHFQTLQLEYDHLQDDVERQKSEVKELTKALELAVNESAALKVQLLQCQEEKECRVKDMEACIKDKQKLELANKELCTHIQSLKKEKEAENISRKEQEKEVKRLEDELKAGEKKLAEEIDHHKITQELLEASRQECKKHSVLSLEIEDYEVRLHFYINYSVISILTLCSVA
jgi:chromosome segregation ATPase